MSVPGETIQHASLGMRCTWIETPSSSGGRVVAGEMFVPALCPMPPAHVHPSQEERLRVLAGAATVTIAGTVHRLEAGDEAVVPVGVSHTFVPADDEDLTLVTTLSPALDWDRFCTLAWAVPSDTRGRPDFLRMALVMNQFPGHLYMAGPPVSLQKAVIKMAAALARLTGRSLPPGSQQTDQATFRARP